MLPDNRFYLDNIFDSFMDRKSSLDIMKCDIYENDGNYHIEADIPGFKKEEINVEYDDGYIKIMAEKNNDNEIDNDKKYIKRERFYGKIVRKFYVGDVDDNKIEAHFTDGKLELIVPKEEKISNKKMIEIK